MSDSGAEQPGGQDLRKARRKKNAPLPQGDELPPHSEEAERGVLGCIALAPGPCLLQCQEAGVREDWFYDLRHQLVYHHYTRLFATLPPETAIDVIILHQRLKESGELEQIGGLTYLNQLTDAVPSAANLDYYLDLVREKWMLRTVLAACANMALGVRESGASPTLVLDEALQDLNALAETAAQSVEQKLRHWLPAVIDNLEDYHRGHAQMRGLSTGLDNVDKMLCGIGREHGNMIVIAARPGIGKTAVALQLAQHAALDCTWFDPVLKEDGTRERDKDGKPVSKRCTKAPVAIFSLEMAAEALTDRMVWQRAQGDKQRWRSGFFVDSDLVPLTVACAQLSGAEIYIDDTPRCTIEELVAKARRMQRQYGIRLFVVDYLQLLRSAKRDWAGDRVQELAYISGLLFATAKLLNVPFIILAQMNRDWEKENARAPRLSDLKDSGAIEQDADLVGFLYKPKQKKELDDQFEEMLEQVYVKPDGKPDWSRHPVRVNLLWEKNRFGQTGDCWLLFHKSSTRFEDFNVWMKNHDFKEPAAGEPKYDKPGTPPEMDEPL